MSERTKKTLGAVQVFAVLALAVAGLVAATVVSMPANTTRTSAAGKSQPAPLAATNYLDVLGLSPDALAAAGLNAGQAGVIKANLQAHLDGEGSNLQATIDTWGTAYRDADMARRAVQSSKGTVEELTAKNTSLTTALAAKQGAINTAIAASASQLDNNTLTLLARIKANRPQNVPVQYLVTDRTDEQWRQLRDALSQKKQRDAATPPREIAPDAAAIINDANAEPAVATAAANVTNNLAAILAAMQ